MSEDLRKLTEVLPPPDGEKSRPDWSAVTAALGTEVPRDYRELIEKYGGGLVDDHLYVLAPSAEDSGYELLELNEERAEANEEIWASGTPKPAQLKGDARLIVWACTDDGQYVYWLAEPGKSPDDWTVLVEEGRGPGWEHFEMGAVAFLVGTLTGEVRSKLLNSDYPTDPHEYAPMSSFSDDN